jgi:hypothetical protein
MFVSLLLLLAILLLLRSFLPTFSAHLITAIICYIDPILWLLLLPNTHPTPLTLTLMLVPLQQPIITALPPPLSPSLSSTQHRGRAPRIPMPAIPPRHTAAIRAGIIRRVPIWRPFLIPAGGEVVHLGWAAGVAVQGEGPGEEGDCFEGPHARDVRPLRPCGA